MATDRRKDGGVGSSGIALLKTAIAHPDCRGRLVLRGVAAEERGARYRAVGLPCGSGAVESAHRHVLQKRMKLAGQHWIPDRADRLAQLRAALYPAIRRTGSYG